ncbi:MAG: hypothetical protein ACON4P_07460 [Candidatus Puniceispirillales bacterium]
MRPFFLVLISLVLAAPVSAFTIRDDGSIVQNDGTVTRASNKERYLDALSDYRAGRPVTGFPTARKSSFLGLIEQEPTAPSGYFGADIVEEGAPLFPMPSSIDTANPVESIASNLGMSSKQFTAALVSSASESWLEENSITPDVVSTFDETVDTFLAADSQASALIEDGVNAINATGLTAEDIRTGKLDALFENPEALLEAAPVLIGAPADVQAALQARAQSVLAEAKGIDLSALEAIDIELDTTDTAALAAAAQAETERLLAEGMNAVNGTDLTVDDILSGKLDETIGIDTALVNASDDVYAAYEARISEKLAEEAGISVEEINFVNQAVMAAGVSSAEEASQVAAEAASQFNAQQGAAAMADAQRAAAEADNLADIAEELQRIAEEEGTAEAIAAAQQAAQSAEQAAEAAAVAGEAAMAAASGAVARTAEEAAWEAASQNAYEQALSAAMAAGQSAEQAAAEAAEAAAAAGQAAFEAAAVAAGKSASEAADQAAAEAAEQAALRELEQQLESGQITEEEFQEAIQDVPAGAE